MSDVLTFAESWTAYTTGTVNGGASNGPIFLARWTSTANGQWSIIADSIGQYAELTASGVSIFKTLRTHNAAYTVGFRVRIPTIAVTSLFTIYNNAQALGAVSINADGTVTLSGQSAGVSVIGTTNESIHAGKWYYFEVSISLTGTTNINVAMILKINGSQILSGNINTGVNNTNLTSRDTTLNRIGFAGVAHLRDIYVNIGASQFDGDITIRAIRPDGDLTSGWICSTGTTEYVLVNENFSDFDTTYVYQTATGSQAIWSWQDLPTFSGTIKGIQISIMARKDDEGSKSFEIVTGTTGTETASPEFFVGDDYVAYFHCQDNDPATGVPYTVSGFNAKPFGIKVIS
jgi:hypothetical protein